MFGQAFTTHLVGAGVGSDGPANVWDPSVTAIDIHTVAIWRLESLALLD